MSLTFLIVFIMVQLFQLLSSSRLRLLTPKLFFKNNSNKLVNSNSNSNSVGNSANIIGKSNYGEAQELLLTIEKEETNNSNSYTNSNSLQKLQQLLTPQKIAQKSLTTTKPKAKTKAKLNDNKSNNDIIKVVTDIDDTVVSSGGVKIFGIKLGGIDKQYKRGHFYPGVIQFALELSRANSNSNSKKSTSSATKTVGIPAKVAVLTARAREFKFALELKANGKLCSAYRSIANMNGLNDWGIGDVYYGSVAEWIFQWRKGIRKFRNFEIMMINDELLMNKNSVDNNSNSDENTTKKTVNNKNNNCKSEENSSGYKYILIGDTGEKDEEAGERIAQKYPGRIKAIFLHNVSDLKDRKQLILPVDREVNGVPIVYFKTYIGAAIKAYELNLLSKDAVQRVATQAFNELLTNPLDPLKLMQNNLSKGNKLKLKWKEFTSKNKNILPIEQTDCWSELEDDLKKASFLTKPTLVDQ